jgi:hypothetical protein
MINSKSRAARPVPLSGSRRISKSGGKPGARKRDLRLPHERDEGVPDARPAPDGVMQRAYRDLAEGQTDTDCRNSAATIVRRAQKKGQEPNN